MMNKTVSVIIPSYNEEQNIKNCIESVLNCEYPSGGFEIILVDNGSTDNTVDIAKKFQVNIFICPGKAIGALRNFGVKEAKGNYLAFLDADCTVSQNWIKNGVKILEDPSIGITGNRLKSPTGGTWIEKTWDLHLQSYSKQDSDVLYINSGNCFLRRDAYQKVRGFSEIIETNEDVDLCERLKAAGFRIFCSSEIHAIHWGYPKTLKQFYKREAWHGLGDAKRNMPFFWRSKPLMLSVYNIAAILICFLSMAIASLNMVIIGLVVFILPYIYLVLLLNMNRNNLKAAPKSFFLYLVYGFARTASLMKLFGFRRKIFHGRM